MKSLYFRLFVWLWTAVAAMVSSIVFYELTFDYDDPPSPIRFLDRHITSVGKKAFYIYKNQGPDAAKTFLNSNSPDPDYRFSLYTPDDPAFPISNVPKDFRYQLGCQDNQNFVSLVKFRSRLGAVKKLSINHANQMHSIFIVVSGRDLAVFFDATKYPVLLVLRLLFIFIIGVSICYVLYRNLVKPINHLEEAARQIGNGSLSARIPAEVEVRKDEIGEMARSFNTMANRLEKLIQTQTQLFQDVSHELRSPLTRLVLALNLAENQDEKNLPKWFDRLNKEAEQMDSLIHQFLTLAKIESVPEKVELKKIEVVSLLETLAEDARFEGQRKKITVKFDYDQPVSIVANRPLLTSALENIIRNAIRHTTEQSEVEISLRSESDEILLSIADQGPGCSESELEEIFRPFYSKSQSETEDSGVGIGLSISRRVVEQLRGTITAKNRITGGLQIDITLPIKENQ